MSAEARTVVRLLCAAWRRRALLLSMIGACFALVLALPLLVAGWWGLLSFGAAVGSGAAFLAAGALAGWSRALRDRRRIAHNVEARLPACRNLLVTAAELLAADAAGTGARRWATPRAAPPPPPEIQRLVVARAASLARELDAGSLFPARRALLTLVAGLVVWGGAAALVDARPRAVDDVVPAAQPIADATPAIATIEVTVSPPAYTGRQPQTLRDPARLEVIAGSRLEIAVQATASEVELTTLEGSALLQPGGGDVFSGAILAESDGFIAFEPRSDGRVGRRRLVGLVVAPDAPPRVRLTEPGRDLFLPQAGEPIALQATAQDDLGLSELGIVYTIVSGSGETFEFTDGELAVDLSRPDGLSWSAAAELAPRALGLSLGDMVVYRAVARDRRPGAPRIESDAFVLEIVGRDAAISGGFALESDEQREGLSQRMVIIKTEALLARRDALSAQDYADEARRIAAEQRMVRAEFVFMMGGEVQDEVEEAAHEHEVAAGRLELRGRREMSLAVQLMSRAAASLTGVNLEAALPLELEALEHLQSALSRSRYILRTFSQRESIDLQRRLTGDIPAARGDLDAPRPPADAELAALRRALAELAAVSAAGGGDAGALADLAEAVVRIDPSSPLLQDAAADVMTAVAGGPDAAGGLARALDALRDHVDERLPAAPPDDPAAELAGALADELAASGGGR